MIKEMEVNKIIQGDALELVPKIDNESIDLIVVDPPYGDNIGYGRLDKKIANNEDETINYKILPILYDKLRTGGVCYIFTNWKFSPLISQFCAKETGFSVRMQLVIVKNNFGMGYGFRNQYELVLVLEKGKVKYNRNDVSNVLKMENILCDKNTHPHEKGVGLLKLLIEHSSKEGDLILDCFAGSGSTLVACKQLKRNFIGIELDEHWCKIAEQRIKSISNPML